MSRDSMNISNSTYVQKDCMSNFQNSKPEVSQQILCIWNENEDKNSEDNGKLDKLKNFEELLKKQEDDVKKYGFVCNNDEEREQAENDIKEFGKPLGNNKEAQKKRNKLRFEKQRNEYNDKN